MQFIKIFSDYKTIRFNINILQQTACLVVKSIMVGNFNFLFSCTLASRTSDSMTFPTWRLINERVRVWCCVCSRAHQALIVGFHLLRYSAVHTVESLSLFYLLFISRFVFNSRWYIDKLGIFLINQTSSCLDPHQKYGWGWYHKLVKALQKVFYWPFQGLLLLGILFVIYVSCCLICSLQPCGHLLGKGWPLGSLGYDVFLCFVTFPYGFLGQVWYLIVSIPDICLLPCFNSKSIKTLVELSHGIQSQRLTSEGALSPNDDSFRSLSEVSSSSKWGVIWILCHSLHAWSKSHFD